MDSNKYTINYEYVRHLDIASKQTKKPTQQQQQQQQKQVVKSHVQHDTTYIPANRNNSIISLTMSNAFELIRSIPCNSNFNSNSLVGVIRFGFIKSKVLPHTHTHAYAKNSCISSERLVWQHATTPLSLSCSFADTFFLRTI